MGQTARQAVDTLESCFAAIVALDADRLVAHYTEDYVLELPYWKPGESHVVEGRDAARSFLAGILGGQRMDIKITKSNWIEDEQLLIAEYVSEGEYLDDGEPYQNSYVGYWFFEGDLICRTREYYNPQASRAATTD